MTERLFDGGVTRLRLSVKVGDLARVNTTRKDYYGVIVPVLSETAFVTEIKESYSLSTSRIENNVVLMFFDGYRETWYEYQLELISESL